MTKETSFQYFFTPNSSQQFKKLPAKTRRRIYKKLEYYCHTSKPTYFARQLKNHKLGEYRFRIGNYRIIFEVRDKSKLVILAVGHRRDIYR